MLQTQLQEAQQELKEAARQHQDDLIALREEGSTLLQDKIDLQKQMEDLKSQLVAQDESQRLVEQEVQEKLREAQEYGRIQKELESEKAR
ncbi:centrosome-associated protein CEP250-like isoform X2 [Tupaia chinensis]|nr:centrosome-associated protein CEP250-like isoform X2 [Tupaia chinensis]